jgi:hypothetical protein
MDKDCTAAIAVRGEQIKTSSAEYLWFCRGIKPPLAAGQAGPERSATTTTAPAERHHACNEARYSPMIRPRQLHVDHFEIDRLDIDHGANDAPSPRRQSNAQQGAPGYLWNSTTQELIPILPEDHPDYRKNQEIIAAAIRRWNQGASK